MALKPDQQESSLPPLEDKFTAPWISHDKLPDVLKEFDLNRDPMIRAQRLDMERSEADRRRQQSGRSDTGSGGGNGGKQPQPVNSSRMIGKDETKPVFAPPSDIRGSVDRANFNNRWMIEKRDAVLARADPKSSLPKRSQKHEQDKFQSPSP